MTKQFDRLLEEPQTNIKRADLNLEERSRLRMISITATPGRSKADPTGKLTSVFYLEGDEQRAAACFAEENERALKQVNFKSRNVVEENTDRLVYDWILHALGERILTKYPTVVVERRPSGRIWIIDREWYEARPNRRYSVGKGSVARLSDESLQSVFDRSGDVITESDLIEMGVEGDVRQVLDVFRSDSSYECEPITANDELAVKKNLNR